MNCEEFANLAPDLDAPASHPDTSAAREHLRSCPACAAFYESSRRLSAELRDLGLATSEAGTASRVEMRLRQEFRTRHKTEKNHGRAVVAGWLLAAATLLLVAGSLFFWRRPGQTVAFHPSGQFQLVPTADSGPELGGTLIAENDGDEFALIPGALPGLQDETSVVRVQMQRGSLSALGLTVNEEHASDVVEVDLLLGADGQPQAYRLPQAQTAN
jgi:predicted anti-sigma-YlaC factor YlaD